MIAGAESLELQPGERVGRYVVEALIGRGGMGRVYRARDQQLGRRVALKVLALRASDPAARREAALRMEREARAAAAFTHPNVVAVYDVGEVGGDPFIAMELVRGRALRAFVGDQSIALAERLRWLRDVALALAAAHRVGLVHRDVKPENVIVSDDGVVKLLDFGVARRVVPELDGEGPTSDSTLTVAGGIVGTPAYMAPEQLKAERVDHTADQFSWGVTAWELLAGKRLWSETGAHLIAAVLSRPAAPLEVPGLARHVSDAVARALAKSRSERFADMDALVAALDGKAAARRPRYARALAAALIGLGALAAALVLVPRARRSNAVPPATAPLAIAPSPPPSHDWPEPCVPQRTNAYDGCLDDFVNWCDPNRKHLACCAPGLLPVGPDGACACPPGGSTKTAGCPLLHSPREYISRYLMAALWMPTLHDLECDGRRFALEELRGMMVHIRVSPDGHVAEARISESSNRDAAAQACLIRRLKERTVDPPPDGWAEIGYGSDIVSSDEKKGEPATVTPPAPPTGR